MDKLLESLIPIIQQHADFIITMGAILLFLLVLSISKEDRTVEKKKPFVEIYHAIDAQCISETDTVKMSDVETVLVKFGMGKDAI